MISEEQKLKLELVQSNGIVKLLLAKCDNNLLQMRVENLLDAEIKNLKTTLGRLSKKQLIYLVERSEEILNVDVDEIYELHRYGLKPGFTLSYLGKSEEIESDKLKELLDKELAAIEYQDDAQYKKIASKAIEKISGDTLEVSFTYLNKHTYISEEEKPDFIYELKDTFVWINIKDGYMAIKNTANTVINILKSVFSKVYNTRISTIRLTKQMINEVFGENKMRKGTFYKPNANEKEAEKVTIADTRLAEKPNVREAYKGYDLTSSALEEQIGEDLISTLGINCKQGKIYLTKNLAASDFRAWSVKRIKDIIAYMNGANLEEFANFRVQNVMDNSLCKSYTENQKKIIEKIIFSLYCAKKYDLDSFMVESTITEIVEKCDKFFTVRLVYECDECGEICIARCSECGSANLILNKKKVLICSECGKTQEAVYNVQCEQGHDTSFVGLERVVELQPTLALIDTCKEILKDYFGLELYENEFFYIHDGNLVIIKNDNKGQLLNIHEADELKKICDVEISADERDVLIERFRAIKEKCRKHGNKWCNQCNYTDQVCIMKLFSIFDFRPSPHQNSEFGDVNFQIKMGGEKLRIVGIAKSKVGKQDTLTVSTAIGREMIQQVLSMSHDERVDIIAPICPMRFHPQLVAEIEYIARKTGKKAMVIDDEFMIRLLKYHDMLKEIAN